MAFQRPTLAELVSRISTDLVTRLGLAGAPLRRAFVWVLARVIAGAAHLLHGHLEFLGRQLFPDQSEGDFLVRQAGLFGLSLTAPTYARASIVLTGAPGESDAIAGDVFLSAEGVEYELDADVHMASLAWTGSTTYHTGDIVQNGGKNYVMLYSSNPDPTIGDSAGSGGPTGTGQAIVDLEITWRYIATAANAAIGVVTARTPGAAGSLVAGAVLTYVSPQGGFDSTVTVLDVLADGTDTETVDALRVRLLEHLREPAHGGTAADYVAWAKSVGGVTRVWVSPLELGAGTVLVRFVRDNDPGPIPDAGEIAAVQAVLDAEAPAHATPTAAAPSDAPLAFTLSITPDTSALRAAVTAALRDELVSSGSPGATTLLSALRTAVGATPGITDYTMTSPAANVTHTAGQLVSLGTITWV